MPWTFAHPAAVLPLRLLCPRWLSLPALILGSLAPDLGYYAGLGDGAAFCHTPLGIAAGCLPMSFLLLGLLLRFHLPLTVLLSTPHRQLIRAQLQPMAQPAPLAAAVAAASILLGATSHVLWDSFTHAGRWGVSLLPWLDLQLFAAGDRQIRVFNVLQHLSTALGLVAMAIVYWRALRSQAAVPPGLQEARSKRQLLACATGAITAGTVLAWLATATSQPAYVSHLVVRAVICSTTLFSAIFVAASLIWWRRHGDA